MTLFILISVLLVLLLFAIALKPLWLKQRGLAGALLLGCAGLTAGLYWQFGRPEAIGYQAPQSLKPSSAGSPPISKPAFFWRAAIFKPGSTRQRSRISPRL
jgi:predicted signal transduction protein with EAL and GGDEF domain